MTDESTTQTTDEAPNEAVEVDTAQVEGQAPDAEQGDDSQPSEKAPEETDKEQELSHEDALAALRNTRKENAGWRTKYRELEASLKDLKSTEDVESLIGELESKNASERRALIAENAALAAGLDSTMAARLVGDTREELEADAKALAEQFSNRAPLRGGNGGLDPSEDGTDIDPEEQYRKIKAARRPW